MSINWEEVLCRLAEIHTTATSPDDTNINLIIEESDLLAFQCVEMLCR